MKPFHTLSLGAIYLDIYCLDFPFVEGFKVETQTVGDSYTTSPGGSVVIFSSAAAHLDLKPVLIGKVGSDAIGEIVTKQLTQLNIKTELLKSKDHSTNMSVNFINKQGKNLLATVGNANQALHADEILPLIHSYLDLTEYLYLGGVYKLQQLLDIYPQIIAAAKVKGVKVVLDHGRVTNVVTPKQINLIKEIIPDVDIYIPSKDEFLQTFSVDTVEAGLEKVRTLTTNTITIITDAEEQAIAMDLDGSILYEKSISINPVNTIGAGDTFNAGFIKAQIDGKSLAQSISFAHKVAAYKISKNNYPKLSDLVE